MKTAEMNTMADRSTLKTTLQSRQILARRKIRLPTNQTATGTITTTKRQQILRMDVSTTASSHDGRPEDGSESREARCDQFLFVYVMVYMYEGPVNETSWEMIYWLRALECFECGYRWLGVISSLQNLHLLLSSATKVHTGMYATLNECVSVSNASTRTSTRIIQTYLNVPRHLLR